MRGDEPEWEFTERDTLILEALAEDPQRSSRDIAAILETEHDIDVSHVTVSESVRKMRRAGVFREVIIPHETFFHLSLLEFKFDPDAFEAAWQDALDAIRQDRYTFLYFLSDGEYQWKTLMLFPDEETESTWIHDFYSEHGDVIENVRNSVIYGVEKFETEPAMFGQLPAGREVPDGATDPWLADEQ